jgi:hypothetical protein
MLAGSGALPVIAGGVFAMAGLAALAKRAPFATAVLVAPAVATAAGLVLLGQPIRPRFFFPMSGVAALATGAGLGLVGSRLAPARAARTTVVATVVLAIATVPSLVGLYRAPKQDFDGAVRFLEAAEAQGTAIAVAGPACDPFDLFGRYYGKAWPCLATADAWRAAESARPLFVVSTLTEYIPDASLLAAVRSCAVVRRFAGTLGGGEIVVCGGRREGGRP